MTTVIINDLAADQRHAILFNRPQDFVRADTLWQSEDPLLVGLQQTDLFKDRTRWCDLSPLNYRFLLLNMLNKVALLHPADQSDPTNTVMGELTFLLTAFIKCMEDRAESNIDVMKISRVNEHEVLYDFTGSINLHMENITNPKKGLRLIVDRG